MTWLILKIVTFLGVPRWLAYLIVIGIAVASIGGMAWGAYSYIWNKGYYTADAEWQAKALQAKIDKLERELAVQALSDAEERRLTNELDDERAALETKLKDYENALALEGNSCPLTKRDLDGLP